MKYMIGKSFKDDNLNNPIYTIWDSETLKMTKCTHDELLWEMTGGSGLVLENITQKEIEATKNNVLGFEYVNEDLAQILNAQFKGKGMKYVIPIQDMVEAVPIDYHSNEYSIFMYRYKTAIFYDIILFFYEKLYMFHMNRHITNRETAEIHLPFTINGEKEVIVRQFDAVLYGYDSTEDTFNIFFCAVMYGNGYLEGFGVKIYKDGLVEVIDEGVIDTYQNNDEYDETDFKRAVLSVKRKQIFD